MRIRANGEAQIDIPLFAHVGQASSGLDRACIADEVVDLYDNLRLPLFRYLISLDVSSDQAEDIVQETFLRAYKHLIANGLGHDSNLHAWVFRVAHNLAITHKKISARSRLRWSDGYYQFLRLSDPTASPEQCLARKERLQRMSGALATLSKRERQCLHLRAEGLRYAEIAAIVHIGVSTVAETMNRALKKLID